MVPKKVYSERLRYQSGTNSTRAWRYLTRTTLMLDDGQMFISIALRLYHETVIEILELTKKVGPAGWRQYQTVATFFKVECEWSRYHRILQNLLLEAC